MKRTEPKVIEIKVEELQETLQHAATSMGEIDYERIKAVFEAYTYMADELGKNRVSLGRLKKLLFGAKTEKTEAVIGAEADAAPSASSGEEPPAESTQETDAESQAPNKRKGHGRNGADAYHGAEKIPVPHPSLEAGDDCPECQAGTVYNMTQPKTLVRLVGQAPVRAAVYQLQRLRCNLCGKIFTAPLPDGVGTKKYDATTGSIIGLLKYGSGFPFNRLAGLQGSFGIPLPASTQWDIIADVFLHIEPASIELIRQAAQGDVLYNDDTTIKILDLMGKRAKKRLSAEKEQGDSTDQVDPSRTGMFTSGIVSTYGGRKIALFFSGRKHAGENLATVLAERATALPPPIQMCDALSRNVPGELKTILANCLAHSRRRFADVAELFPDECEHVLRALEVIYKNDADARKRKLSPDQRLKLHQAESRPTMDNLHSWLNRQLDERLIEPNSALGEAITYMLKYWEKLTLFLHKAGAPLDNNICERALKKAILHRKNSMFFKSKRGARIADAFMSLIYTCELCGANPFDYLTDLQRNAAELASAPENWMPWNYRETLAAITMPSVPVC